ncbi:Ty3/gypsy retrotransposon protein [Senna tora]|uniref:Ty3/gypsy retrotransposon protein n=1 Tax=Senna tora TaxID=362788 RepID=A0A834WJP7_9FABA|nr:Ty3/gypsy retrotransposon protein [Senna tora]
MADALSRSCFMACLSPVFTILDDVRRALLDDTTTAQIIMSQCHDNALVLPFYTLRDGVLYWKDRIVVPSSASTLKQSLLHEYHASPMGGVMRVICAPMLVLHRCFTGQICARSWFPCLSWAECWYNTAYHTAIGMTSFKAVYGRDPPHLPCYSPMSTDAGEVQDQLLARDALLHRLKLHLQRSQERMKHFTDKKRSELQFQVGDSVFVRLQPYHQHSLQLRRNQKLGMRFFGPFPIVERIGEVAYRLQLPSHAKIHDVFHVSQLKRCVGSIADLHIPLPLLTTQLGPVISPLSILHRREVQVGNQWETQLLVAWDDDSSPTWECMIDFQQSYPNFDLKDKVTSNGGGNVISSGPKQAVVKGSAQVQQTSPNVEGPSENWVRRSVRMKKPTWKYMPIPVANHTPSSSHRGMLKAGANINLEEVHGRANPSRQRPI